MNKKSYQSPQLQVFSFETTHLMDSSIPKDNSQVIDQEEEIKSHTFYDSSCFWE